MRRVREDHLHRTIVRCQRTAFKVQSDTHPAKSRCGDLSCNDPVSPEQTACPATDASNGGSSRDPREVRVLLGAAKRRFVQPPAVRGVVSNRTEQKKISETTRAAPYSGIHEETGNKQLESLIRFATGRHRNGRVPQLTDSPFSRYNTGILQQKGE